MKTLRYALLATWLCGSSIAAAPSAPTCSAKPPPELTEYEQRAVKYVAEGIQKAGSLDGFLAGAKPGAALKRGGFDLEKLDTEKVKAGVEHALRASGSEISMTRCAEFGACAIGVDLTDATGERLVRYTRQKAEDGADLKRKPAPAFSLKDLEGRTVTLAQYRGKRVALVFWQSHCSHSMKNLPVWDALRRDLAGKRFQIVTVLFNGGEASYVKQWYGKMGHALPVLLAPTEDLATSYGSHLVPSVFLIDEKGRLVRKLVTEKSETALRRELTAFATGRT
jgi:hypothetical protein